MDGDNCCTYSSLVFALSLIDILNINNAYIDNIVSQIYPSELQLNKTNTPNTEAAFLDLHLSISNDIVSTKIHDKRDDFDFEIVNFPFLDGSVPLSTSNGVYISQLIRFARASSYVADFNTRNKLLTQKRLKQGFYPPVKYFTDRSKAVLLLWILYVFVLSCVCYVLCASVYMCFVVTCWERADLLALVCGVFCEFVTFPLVSLVRCGT